MPTYTAKDGHVVKSRAELLIDNLLHEHKIPHEYEAPITFETITVHPDWYLPEQNVYIEFWGMEDQRAYREKELDKLQLYAENQITCLSVKNEHLENYKALEKKILDFVSKYSKKTKTQQFKSPVSQVGQKSKPRSERINILDLRKGLYCYFCLQPKKPDKRKPLCWDCYSKLQERTICALCGESLGQSMLIKDEDPYVVYVCSSCDEEKHKYCKICGEKQDYPQKGKSLCYKCYSIVSLASPGLPTPKWAKRRRKQYYPDF